jgi:hypothetical protein
MANAFIIESEKFLAGLEKLVARQDMAAKKGTANAAMMVEREIKSVQLTRWGRHSKGTPTHSEPGTPPAQITGTLRASVVTEGPHQKGFGKYEAQVGPTAVYARIQELGGEDHSLTGGKTRTVTGARRDSSGRFLGGTETRSFETGHGIPPRPYVAPAVRAQLPRIGQMYRQLFEAAL